MLHGQMSTWQLEPVLDVPRYLLLKFGQNRVSKSWDIRWGFLLLLLLLLLLLGKVKPTLVQLVLSCRLELSLAKVSRVFQEVLFLHAATRAEGGLVFLLIHVLISPNTRRSKSFVKKWIFYTALLAQWWSWNCGSILAPPCYLLLPSNKPILQCGKSEEKKSEWK